VRKEGPGPVPLEPGSSSSDSRGNSPLIGRKCAHEGRTRILAQFRHSATAASHVAGQKGLNPWGRRTLLVAATFLGDMALSALGLENLRSHGSIAGRGLAEGRHGLLQFAGRSKAAGTRKSDQQAGSSTLVLHEALRRRSPRGGPALRAAAQIPGQDQPWSWNNKSSLIGENSKFRKSRRIPVVLGRVAGFSQGTARGTLRPVMIEDRQARQRKKNATRWVVQFSPDGRTK